MKKPTKCAVCDGQLVDEVIKYDQHWGDDIVVFEDVPARVCHACGEIWLSSQVVQAMDKVLKSQKKPTKEITIPVWSLADVHAA